MRILHLISQRPDSTGSGIYIQELLSHAARNGHENHLVAGIQAGQVPDLPQIPADRCTFAEFGTAALPFPIVGMSDVMPYPSSVFGNLSTTEISQYEQGFSTLLSEVVRSFRPQIIHSHHLWLLTSLARRLFPDIPMITTCHGSDLRQFRNCPHLRDRVLSGCRHLDAILALSMPQKEEIHQLYQTRESNIVVVGGGYNSTLFFRQQKPEPSPVRLLFGGKLSYAKGVLWFLKALNNLEDQDWHLDLVGGGDGEEYDNCLQLARKRPTNITIHGPLPQLDLASLMRKAHVMVLPSLFEGLPLIVLEAIASGCRVVATDLPGTREIYERLQTPCIHLVTTPPLHQVDKLRADAEEGFVKDLGIGLQQMIDQSRQQPALVLDTLQQRIDHYSWAEVYVRTEAIYNGLLASSI
jgi:glycosyltransferase involved in cell wall biosynthesis